MKRGPGRRIEIHIEELVLENRAGGDQIGDAIRAELSRQITQQRSSWRGHGLTAIASIDAGEIAIAKHTSAAAQGRAIAGATHRALQQAQSGRSIGTKGRSR